ncbi:MAG: N-formylglutamate amidohydrolase [Alphaproteobacteria bacterium]|nr:N-formylglutamate amidohydrolase [Alphaproteobacteria bacterium]
MSASFDQMGPTRLNWPVILSVPHAGRDYPDALEEHCRFAPQHLRGLEDRYADLLVAHAEKAGFTGLIARTPRTWIDLNRAEQDLDPAMLTQALGPAPYLSAKARGGLGLIPRRTASLGEIWRHKLTPEHVRTRIAQSYRPYHETLSALLNAAKEQFGGAILLDVHSMPPLPATRSEPPPDIVIGDRFGRSAARHVTAQIALCAQAAGFRTTFNAPYAGGHILDQHARPDKNIHGVQLEIDRRLYLDADLAEPGQGLANIQKLVADIAQHLADALQAEAYPLAAE